MNVAVCVWGGEGAPGGPGTTWSTSAAPSRLGSIRARGVRCPMEGTGPGTPGAPSPPHDTGYSPVFRDEILDADGARETSSGGECMSQLGPGRPADDECLPYYFQYIRLVPDGDIVESLERQITDSVTYLATLTPEQACSREAPGEWNPVEIVGHVADTERVFAYRALRIARADPVMWTAVDFEDYARAANFEHRALADVVGELAAVRVTFVALLRGLDAAAWARRASAEWTLRSVRAVAYCMAGHELHHLADIRRQVSATASPRRT